MEGIKKKLERANNLTLPLIFISLLALLLLGGCLNYGEEQNQSKAQQQNPTLNKIIPQKYELSLVYSQRQRGDLIGKEEKYIIENFGEEDFKELFLHYKLRNSTKLKEFEIETIKVYETNEARTVLTLGIEALNKFKGFMITYKKCYSEECVRIGVVLSREGQITISCSYPKGIEERIKEEGIC